MKKTKNQIMIILIATIAIFFSACHHHHDDEHGPLTQKEIQITENIKGVIIEGPWEVSITQSDDNNSASIEYNVAERKIVTEFRPNGILFIRAKSGSYGKNTVLRATIKAELLERIDGSGASTINTYGEFMNSCDIDLSGASKLDGYWCEGKTAKLKASGASHIKNFTFVGEKLTADLSGASDLSLKNIEVENFKLDASGASTVKGSGYAEENTFTGSGASTIKVFDIEMENLHITLSGASNGEVTVNRSIKGRLSGASELRYKRAGNVQVDVDGASKLIRVD